jgi:hypothetical protein
MWYEISWKVYNTIEPVLNMLVPNSIVQTIADQLLLKDFDESKRNNKK